MGGATGAELPAPLDLLRPGRDIRGTAAVLLPFTPDGAPDWHALEQLLGRTVEAGLTPAVNMDTGYVHVLGAATRNEVLVRTRAVAGAGGFVAGALVDDVPGDGFDLARHVDAALQVAGAGGLPVVFPSFGLSALDGPAWVEAHEAIGERVGSFLAFELSPVFTPAGSIRDLATYEGLLSVDTCLGAKHSSLRRQPEWDRLRLRDRLRPDFRVLTGNDLAIDLVMYGSDYLLGLAAFAPDLFARRDRAWAEADPCFFEVNDALQALGAFAFRAPVPAYKHSCAQFLHLRGWLPGDDPPPGAPRRPDTDRAVLATLLDRLGHEVGPA